MPNKSLSRSGLLTYQKYSSLLAGNDPFIPGAYDLLETEILTGTQSSVTFSSLDSYSDYQHLQFRAMTRDNFASSDRAIDVTVNGDSTASYSSHRMYSKGSSFSNNVYTSQTIMQNVLGHTAASSSANSYGAWIFDVLDAFETTKYKTFRALHGHTDQDFIATTSGLWQNTAGITSVEFVPSGGNFISGSRISLYGLRGA